MAKKILIIEDTPNDIKYYESLFAPDREVGLLFLSRDEKYTREKLIGLIDLCYETIAPKIKNYFVTTESEIVDFLKSHPFDFYIADSLGGIADQFMDKAGLPKEKVAFLSSTTSFRESVGNRGYRAYKKENIGELVKDCLRDPRPQ